MAMLHMLASKQFTKREKFDICQLIIYKYSSSLHQLLDLYSNSLSRNQARKLAKENATMEVQVLKLGTVCKDRATELEGTLTHWDIDMDQRVSYIFQPRGLDEDGVPVKQLYFGIGRLEVSNPEFESVQVPFEILGTKVTDKASGFVGTAVALVWHINGCFHVAIQPTGVNEKTKVPIRAHDFDLRQCEGEMITQLSEKELKQSKKERPSPIGYTLDPRSPHSVSRISHRD